MKKVFILTLAFIVSVASLFLWQVWQNNRDIEPISHTQIEQHFVKSVSWLESNYTNIENVQNPILWWMIKRAAAVSDNSTLNNIYSKYKKQHLDANPPNLSTPMFDRYYRPSVPDITLLSELEDYQIFFFYALSCDKELGSDVIIQRQLKPGFCALHYLHPRCITHQLMGLRFMQRYKCGYDDVVDATIKALQKDVISELTWDFRIGDAYMQRVLMLVDSGAYNNVKPVWIKNILESQNKDGSWDDLDPILHLGDDKVLAYTSTLPKIQRINADFHTTAQAIWLLSLLIVETRSN